MKFLLTFVLLYLSYCFCDYIVETDRGKIRGKLRKDGNGGDFYSFQSIPYAKPPLNELRFKAPQPAESWVGVLDGTKDLPKCYQRELGVIGGQEDCLYLNVYTKKINTSDNIELLPVMVYIHGGGYKEGSAKEDALGPEFLLTEDIVLVVINYRLGAFGSLSFENQSLGVPGNAGLKDQVMALKWVQRNIPRFGGNSRSVTIFGESAGGSSVHLHILSPLSKGLFHKAIMQSGSAIAPWNYGLLGNANLLAKALGIRESDPNEILNQLGKLSTEKIFEAEEKAFGSPRIHERWETSPVIESQTNEPVFLPDDPINIIRSGNYNKVPIITGYMSSEAIIFYSLNHLSTGNIGIPINLHESIPFNLNMHNNTEAENDVIDKIQTFFFGGNSPTPKDIPQNIKLLSSSWFVYPAITSVHEHLVTSPESIYFYKFSADTSLNYYKRLSNITAKYPGASHADELSYLFHNRYAEEVGNGSLEQQVVNRIIKLWTNFAKHGNPVAEVDSLLNVKWNPVSENQINYLEIGTQNLTVGINPGEDVYQFWKSIYEEFA